MAAQAADLPEVVDPTTRDVFSTAMQAQLGAASTFIAFQDSLVTIHAPPANQAAFASDGDPDTCMDWNIGGYSVPFIAKGGNDGAMSIDLGRIYDVDNLRVIADPSASAFDREGLMAMINVRFSETPISQATGDCAKDAGLKAWMGSDAHTGTTCDDCTCTSCPNDALAWPPDGQAMTKSKSARYIVVNLRGLDYKSAFGSAPCGHSQNQWEVPLCHVEVSVRFCDAGYYFDDTSSKCKLCPLGSFCPGGYIKDSSVAAPQSCPEGVFGDQRGLAAATCNGPCSNGYDCSSGGVGDRAAVECNDAKTWCFAGRAFQTQSGFRAVSNAAGLMIGEEQCTPGHYCLNGVQNSVDAGYYTSLRGETNKKGEGKCDAGFRCPAGSTSSQAVPCVDPAIYCPQGTGASGQSVRLSPIAYYGISESKGGFTVFVSEELCPAGSYCQNGVRFACAPGLLAESTGLVSEYCDGQCPAGFFCDSVGSKTSCPPGFYCELGTLKDTSKPYNGLGVCGPGTFQPAVQAVSAAQCIKCAAKTASNAVAATSGQTCLSCHPQSTTPAGSAKCTPKLISVVADDDGADKTPGISDLDVVLFTFDRATNKTAVDSEELLSHVIRFDPDIGAPLRGSWEQGGKVLRVTLLSVPATVDPFATRIGALRAHLLAGAVKDESGLSTTADDEQIFVVGGTWGESSRPKFSIAALVPAARGQRLARTTPSGSLDSADWAPFPVKGDRIVLGFDQPVRRVPVDTEAGLSALLQWSVQPARAFTAAWNARSTVLSLTVSEPHPLSELNATFVAALQSGRLAVAVRLGAGLTSIDGSSMPSNASRAVTGTLATAPLNARVEQHTSASLLVQFQPAQLPPGEVLASDVATTGVAPPLTVTHTIVRWCVGSGPGASGAACDHAAVSVTPVTAGNGSLVVPGDSMLIVSTNHAPIAPGTAVRVWVAAATSDGRVWEWVPAADGEPALHASEAAASAVCRTSPGSRSVGAAPDVPVWQLAQAAGFRMSLNEEASCACSLVALPAWGSSSAASLVALQAASAGTPAEATIAAVSPAGVGDPCDPAALPSSLPTGTACRCRSVVSDATTLEEAVARWFDASAPLAAPCEGSAVLIQAPAVLGIDAPGELSTQGGEAVRIHGRGLGLLPPSLKSAAADHAAFAAAAYVSQRAGVAAFASAAAMTPIVVAGPGVWPSPPDLSPSPRVAAMEHRAGGLLLPLSSVTVSNPSGFEHALQVCTIECAQLSLRCESTEGIGRDYRPVARVGSATGGLDEEAVMARHSVSSSLREVERLALSDAGGTWLPVGNSSINCTAIAVDGLRACIRYGPPVISSFAGNGSLSAITAGGQNVRIQGRQLGPPNDVDVDQSLMVTYSPLSSGRVFLATGCHMTKPHEELECTTAPGAGAQLSWEVIIGRQRSVVPRTSYGAPVLTSLRLFDADAGDVVPAPGTPGFPFDQLDAFPRPASESRLSTAGGDWVLLEGSDLGPNMSFVTRVALSSSGGTGAGESALEQILFAWTGDPVASASTSEEEGTATLASPSPELCWMTVPHSAILCQTVPGAGTGLRAEVSVLGAQSQRTEEALAYAPPSASLQSRLTVPTQGASGVAVVLRNAPPDVSLLSVDVLGANVTTFSMQPVAGARGEAVVSVTVPALPGTTGSISTVPVRLSARGQTASVALGVDSPSITLLDVDSIVNSSAVAAYPPLAGALSSATVLMELQGSSLGANHAVFQVTVGGDNCTLLDKAAIRKYIVSHRVEESLDSHTRLFCWTTRRSGSVIIRGQPGFRGFDFPPLARTYSYSELKRAPSPRRVLPVTNATRLVPMGGQYVAVEGTDIYKEGHLSVEFLYLDSSNENLAPDERPVIASLPCLVQTRGQAAARWPATDPCIEQGVFDLAPVGEAQHNQLCASPTKVLCRTLHGRGQGLFVRVVSNSLSGVSASALVGYAAPQVVRASPAFGPTSGGFELTLSLIDGGDRGLPEDFNVAVPAPAGLAPLATLGTVSVAGKDCPVSFWDDNKVVCTAPAGVSASPVVEVRREQSATLPPGGFAFAPPEVYPLSPSTWPFPADDISAETTEGNATRNRLLAAMETIAQADAALAAGSGLESLGVEFEAKLSAARLTLANGDGPGTALYAMPTDGDRVSLVVWGRNFGPSPTVTLSRLVKVTSGTGAVSETVEQIPCVAIPSQSSHTYAVCRVGEGLGSNINVTVNTGVRLATAPWLVHFQRPAVSGLYVDTLRVDPADWVTAVTSVVSGRKLTTDVDAGFRPATGGFLLHIIGTAFSAAPQVTVGGMSCRVLFAELQPDLISGVGRVFASAAVPGNDGTPAAGTAVADLALLARLGVAATAPIPARWTVDHRRVVCAAPPGIGRQVQVLVSAGGLASEPVQLDYDAPSVQLTVRGFARAGSAAGLETPLGAASITVQGLSFGATVLGDTAGVAFAMRPDAADGAGILAALPAAAGGGAATPTPSPSGGGDEDDDGGSGNGGGSLHAGDAGPAASGRALADSAILDPPPAPAVGYLEAGEAALGSGGKVVDVLVAPWRAATVDSSGVSAAAPALRFKRLCSAESMAAPDVSLQCDVRTSATVDISVVMVRVADASSPLRGLLTLCPEQWYGGLGELCRPCPQGAACPGGFVEPLPLPGFFKRGRSGFSQCVPELACQGFTSVAGGFDFDQMQLGSGVMSSAAASSAARLQRLVRELQEDTGPKDLADVPSVKAALEAIQAAWAGGGEALTGLFPVGGPVSNAWVASQALNEQALQTQCSAGYAGDRCSVCDDRFYRLEADCVPCPDLGWLYMLVGGVVVVLLIGMAYLLQRSQINLSGASVGVDFMQSVALFATLGFRWPVEFKIVLSTIGSANLNLQLLAPSCAIDWSPEIQFYLIVALPLGLTLAAVSAAALVRVTQAVWRVIRKPCGCKRDKVTTELTGGPAPAGAAEPSPLSFLGQKRAAEAARQQEKKRKSSARGLFGRKKQAAQDQPPPGAGGDAADTSLIDVILGAAFSILYFAYLTVCRTSIQWFDCFPIARPDGSQGERVLDADPSIVCDVNESPVYGRVLPLAYVSTVVYGAGVPVVFALILFAYQKEITADQVLRERGEGNSPRTNPNFAVRKRFGRIYGDFRAGFTTWRVALLIRKLALVAVALLFSRQALFAGTLSVLILFISYAAHVKYRPFLTTAALSQDFLKLAQDEGGGGLGGKDLLARSKGAPPARSASAGRLGGASSSSTSRGGPGGRPAASRSGSVARVGGAKKGKGLGKVRQSAEAESAARAKAEETANACTPLGILARVGRVLCPVMVLCMNDAQAKKRLRMRRVVRNARERRRSSQEGQESMRRATAIFNEMQGRGLLSEADVAKANGGEAWARCRRVVCCCYYCCCKRSGPRDINGLSTEELQELAALASESSLGYQFDYNALESSYLSSSITILVGGMVFSTVELVHGSVEYVLLTSFLTLIIASAGASFLYLLMFELYRSVRFAHVFAIARQYEDRLRYESTSMQRHIRGIDVVFKRADKDKDRLAEVGRMLVVASSRRSGAGSTDGGSSRGGGSGPSVATSALGKFRAAALQVGTAALQANQSAEERAALAAVSSNPAGASPRKDGTSAPAFAPPSAPTPAVPKKHSVAGVASMALERLRQEKFASEAGVRSGRLARHNAIALMARAASESGRPGDASSMGSIAMHRPVEASSSRRMGGKGTSRVANALLRSRRPVSSATGAEGSGRMLLARRHLGLDGDADDSDASASTSSVLTPRRLDDVDAVGMGFGPDAAEALDASPLQRASSDPLSAEPAASQDSKSVARVPFGGAAAGPRSWMSQPLGRSSRPSPLSTSVGGARKGFGAAGVPLPSRRPSTVPPGPGPATATGGRKENLAAGVGIGEAADSDSADSSADEADSEATAE